MDTKIQELTDKIYKDVPDVGEGIVSIRLLRMNEVEYLNVIFFLLQQAASAAKHLALRVYDQIGAVGAHNTWFAEIPRFAGAAAAHHKNVQIALVPIPVQPDGNAFCQDGIFPFRIGVLLIQRTDR